MKIFVSQHKAADPTQTILGVGTLCVTDAGALYLHDGATVGGKQIGGVETVTVAVSGAGTTQAGATQIAKGFTVVSTVTSGSGVRLGVTPAVNYTYYILNTGANALLVYPGTGAAINALSVNTGFSVAAGATVILKAISSTLWFAN